MSNIKRASLIVAAVCLYWLGVDISTAPAAKNDWAEGTPAKFNGATRDYYNRAGLLKWQNYMGDWRDAKNKAQGDVAYATAKITSDDRGQFIEWDVTLLVQQWQQGQWPNQGFFLRAFDGSNISFCSRDVKQSEQRPQLLIVAKEKTTTLAAQADTSLNASTYKSLGQGENLRVSQDPNHALLRFDLAEGEGSGEISTATLRLFTSRVYKGGTVGVFRCSQGHDEPASEPKLGLAARYAGDKGIDKDADVIFATGFESPKWNEAWSYAGKMEVLDAVAVDAKRKFHSLSGKALRVRIAEGSTGAMNTLYKFQKKTGSEPEEVYFRYYLRLADDWNQTVQGGKMPGFSGTYGVAGWGGRKSNGRNGWSARGHFSLTIPADNPLGGTTPIGTYCYHADMDGYYGSNWIWQNNYRGFLENNRWYAVEQFLKLNTPGKKDGILRAWVDGRLAFEKSDIRFRHVDSLKIEQLWMNVYHGGTQPSPYDQHLFIDNVVIARKYIGPMKSDN